MSLAARSLRKSFVVAVALAATVACSKKETRSDRPAPPPGPSGSSGAATGGGVAPVYPAVDRIPAEVQAICDALHTMPLERKAACCQSTPGTNVASECGRNLAGALAGGGITLDAAQVKTCTTALASAYEGCDWVGPHPVRLPEACRTIVRGTVAEGKTCRSSLECADGLRCAGAGPTDAGRCRAAAAEGDPCGTAVDPLATYLRIDMDQARPPCAAGFCDRQRCRASKPVGERCRASVQCADGARCAKGTCIEGAVAQAGEPCGGGDCAPGLRCVVGQCTAPKPIGALCKRHADCAAGCVDGHCAQVCSTAALLQHLRKLPNLKPRKLRPALPEGAPVAKPRAPK